jgi:hypothetical protein
MKWALLLAGSIIGIIGTGCNSKGQSVPQEMHQAQIQKEGAGMIYVDKISCSSVMRNEDSVGSNTSFRCFRVGFIDSLTIAKATDKKSLDAGKYYQYDMQKDWVALVNGDSLRPVFYQPRQRMENHRYEGILVFEVPRDKEPDTLVYADSYSSWGTQVIIINGNKK